METKLSVTDILEGKYRDFISINYRDVKNFYMNEDTLFVLHKEVTGQTVGMEMNWEDIKRHGAEYRGVKILIAESLNKVK